MKRRIAGEHTLGGRECWVLPDACGSPPGLAAARGRSGGVAEGVGWSALDLLRHASSFLACSVPPPPPLPPRRCRHPRPSPRPQYGTRTHQSYRLLLIIPL